MAAWRKDGERAPTQADGQITALYALPLNDFVAARKRLATELKKAGDGAEAQRVGALAKPNVAAWVTNQTVRARRSWCSACWRSPISWPPPNAPSGAAPSSRMNSRWR